MYMKEKTLTACINIIKQNKNYNEEKLAEIRYGLEGLYLTVTKLIVIATLSILLNIFIEFIIFAVIYNIIRMPSFGLHATKSWICLISSSIIFIGVPYICTLIELNNFIISIIGIFTLLLIYKNSPADTEKRPIINPKRRMIYKTISVSIAILFITLSFIITNTFIVNCLLFSLIVQCFMISPVIYKIFKLKYNNYKNYINQAI